MEELILVTNYILAHLLVFYGPIMITAAENMRFWLIALPYGVLECPRLEVGVELVLELGLGVQIIPGYSLAIRTTNSNIILLCNSSKL